MAGPWLDPLLVINRRYRFAHGPEDVAAAREFVGPVEGGQEEGVARGVVTQVHERMRINASAFGVGMPKNLPAIVAGGGGNCVSHSVLAAVLLRDHGFPTRLVVEDVYTNVSLLRALALGFRAPIGPTLNGHVWIEVCVDGDWAPADAELGVFGMREWLSARVGRGVTVAAVGVPIREHWKFPLRIRRLGPDGQPADDVTSTYLIDRVAATLGPGAALPAAWTDGVRYFSQSFRWEGRPGLRMLAEQGRLRGMSRARATFAGALATNLADAARGY